MERKKNFSLKLMSLLMSIVFVFEFIVLALPSTSRADSEESVIKESGVSYEESSNLPHANLYNDRVINNKDGVQMYSLTRPNSIEDYKKLGYSNFQYSDWSGDKYVLSTRAKRVGKAIVTGALSRIIPSAQVRDLMQVYSIASATIPQDADVWITVNARNIMAHTPKPDSYEVLIGEESIVKYYSDPDLTKLEKTVHRTNFVG
ncbi:hypothetical protein [Anaerococcus cruorum]|uniref:Uncharacterized protein n=2 Tax=Anaerococcus TaxID=165779 RepID=A0ABW9MUV4_9FIRM